MADAISNPDLATRLGWARDEARVTITVNGQVYPGWVQTEVTRDLETIAGTASVLLSLTPGLPPNINRQDAARIHVGSTLVITGVVMASGPSYRRGECAWRVGVRDRTGDLVHCSAIHQGGQWRKAKLNAIVADLVRPFGLEVVLGNGVDVGEPISDFRLQHGETVLDAVARAARLRGVLVSRDALGRVELTKAGVTRFAGAIVRGMNVIAMDDIGSDANRHSEYRAYGQSNLHGLDFEDARLQKAVATDPDIKRYLPTVVSPDGNHTLADLQALVAHMARVRRGQSLGLRYTVEGWTWKGQCWPVNQRVAVYDDIAGLDGAEWLITSVHQRCDLTEGAVTDLVVRPIEAYDTVPLKSKPRRRNWGGHGGAGSSGGAARGPSDRARGG